MSKTSKKKKTFPTTRTTNEWATARAEKKPAELCQNHTNKNSLGKTREKLSP